VQFNGKPLIAKPMTVRLSPTRARGMMVALIGVFALLSSLPQLYAQGRMATASLVLRVRPEELLQDQSGSVVVKIRLARGTTARLWAANSCISPSPESHVITLSGTYTIPHDAFTPVSSPSFGPVQVCLASSDGVLHDSLPVEGSGAANGTAVQGATPLIDSSGVSVDAPAVWTVTTVAGSATWSKPSSQHARGRYTTAFRLPH